MFQSHNYFLLLQGVRAIYIENCACTRNEGSDNTDTVYKPLLASTMIKKKYF